MLRLVSVFNRFNISFISFGQREGRDTESQAVELQSQGAAAHTVARRRVEASEVAAALVQSALRHQLLGVLKKVMHEGWLGEQEEQNTKALVIRR